jgi:hypothetical protein
MASKTCFVIMPIGDQEFGDIKLTAADLKKRYSDLIKEAILKADPSLEVTRSDEVSLPGSITSDILMRIMHSDLVVADVTYPNPNVFYELGLRHACHVGTVIIRDKNGPNTPFDISHLRHIEYEETPSGLKELGKELQEYFEYIETNPGHTDNSFLELAKLIHYHFPKYDHEEISEEDAKAEFFTELMQSPEFLNYALNRSSGAKVDQAEMNSTIVKMLMNKPKLASIIAKTFAKSNQIPMLGSQSPKKPSKGKRQTKTH